MKWTSIALIFLAMFAMTACDVRSDTAKREMEKFSGTPTPTPVPTPSEAPIDPAKIVQANTNGLGELIDVQANDPKKSAECKNFERVDIYGSNREITVKGVCRQIKVNGDNNKITADAVMAIVFAGENNKMSYTRYVNGKRPYVLGEKATNTLEESTLPLPATK